ncbi:helix-turn-helix domain-containing protein [Flavitalea flava]
MLDFFGIFGARKKRKSAQKTKYSKTRAIEQLKERLEFHMRKERPFLKADYSVRDLAEELNISSRKLSSVIHRTWKVHFTEYLNRYRIDYCQELIKRERDGSPVFKILFPQCGFRNRKTFSTAFKKITGYRPSEYTRTL